MSTPAITEAIAHERLLTYDDVQSDVLRADVGDTIEVPNFENQFDPLVVSIVNANLAGNPEGDRIVPWNEFYLRPDCPRPLGTYPVQQTLGISPQGRQRFTGWPSGMRLPSELIVPRNQRLRVLNASVTLLDKPKDDPSLRGIDLLLQGNVRPARGAIRPVMARLLAQKSNTNQLRARYTTITEEAAAHAVAAALETAGSEEAAS